MKQYVYKLNRNYSNYAIHKSLSYWLKPDNDERILFAKINETMYIQGLRNFDSSLIPKKFAALERIIELPEYENGQIIELFAMVNPTKRINIYAKRVGLSKNEIGAWLQRKFDKIAEILDYNILYGTKVELYLNAYDICILMKIISPELLKNIFQKGFGSAKFCGFGMLRCER